MSIAIGKDGLTPPVPDGTPPAAPTRFRFAATFVIDLAVSLAYVLFLMHLLNEVHYTGLAAVAVATIGSLIMLCYLAKILIIRFLERRGGDARTYVESKSLVTDGPYGWSRNPTYLVALIQFMLWSVLLMTLQAIGPIDPLAMVVATFAPVLFFVVTDRIIIAIEERELSISHPDEFADYASRVGRWIGRF
jgi:protein-S-isoprenylcysteine O-methyltransferase Ste14